jgi:LysR family hydrogen peroxide-inducible transcriptional activator
MRKSPRGIGTLDLNLLYTFRAFAECGSVQGTANKLARSQPAISARLHQLQQELGADLLSRHGRRLELTPLGRAFDAQLADLFSGVQMLLDRARAADEEPAGLLRIGALPTVGAFLLAPRIAAFMRRFQSQVEIELLYTLVPDLPALKKGYLDLVMGVGDPPTVDFEVKVVGAATPVLVVRRGKHKLPKVRVRPSHLESVAWVGYGRVGDVFFDAVWSFLARHGIDKRIHVRVANIQSLKALVAAGAGASVLPDYTVVEPEFDVRRLHGLDFSQPIWIAARPSSLSIPLVAQFWDDVVGERSPGIKGADRARAATPRDSRRSSGGSKRRAARHRPR